MMESPVSPSWTNHATFRITGAAARRSAFSQTALAGAACLLVFLPLGGMAVVAGAPPSIAVVLLCACALIAIVTYVVARQSVRGDALVLDGNGITVRGGRHLVSVPWIDVDAATITNRRGPVLVVARVRRAAAYPDLPRTAYTSTGQRQALHVRLDRLGVSPDQVRSVMAQLAGPRWSGK